MRKHIPQIDSYRAETGKFIRAARIKAKMRQVEVAKLVGHTAQFLSNIERGAAPVPMPLMRKLVKIYDLKEIHVLSFLLKQHARFLNGLFADRK